jgi:transcriptional regulator with XRE-family HTH domain
VDDLHGGVPPSLIADPAFAEACAKRDIGAVFRLARVKAGMHPSRISRLTGLTVSRVGEIVAGRRNPTSMDVLERIADGLRLPGHLFGLAPRQWELSPASAGPATPETWEVVDTLARSDTDQSVLLHLEAAILQTAARYPSVGPRELIPALNRQLAKVHQLLAEPQTLRARCRTVELLSILSGLLGLAHLDFGDATRSAAFMHIGQVASREAQSDALTAWLLTMHSIVLTTTGHVAQAVEVLEHAEAIALGASYRRRSWIAAQLAHAYAVYGRTEAALKALDRSALGLDRADAPDGLDFFTPARLDGIRGTVRLLLRDHVAADALLRGALARRDGSDVKGRAMLAFDLAQCQVERGELDEGCRLAHAAIDLGSVEPVQPVVLRARRIERSLRPWRDRRSVTSLLDRMRESRWTPAP